MDTTNPQELFPFLQKLANFSGMIDHSDSEEDEDAPLVNSNQDSDDEFTDSDDEYVEENLVIETEENLVIEENLVVEMSTLSVGSA